MDEYEASFQPDEDLSQNVFIAKFEYGWPFVLAEEKQTEMTEPLPNALQMDSTRFEYQLYWRNTSLAANIAIALLILASLTTLCEWRIRRKAPRTS